MDIKRVIKKYGRPILILVFAFLAIVLSFLGIRYFILKGPRGFHFLQRGYKKPMLAKNDEYRISKRDLENTVSLLDQKLSATAARFEKKIEDSFKKLPKKLENFRNQVNRDVKEKIAQEEIDTMIKREVDKQVKAIKLRRNAKMAKLKKVVALEKVRRLIQEIAGDDGENVE